SKVQSSRWYSSQRSRTQNYRRYGLSGNQRFAMSLKINNLQKSFNQGEDRVSVLSSVNADIKNGEIVAIVGQSGSGKSTLLSLLAGLDQADQGDVVVDGVNISTMNEKQVTDFRGKNIGIVFQQYHLVSHLTALENVMLPMEILG